MPPSGRVLRRAAERTADGLLCAGADRARRPRARRRGAAGLGARLALGLHAGAEPRRSASSPSGWACGWSRAWPTRMARALSLQRADVPYAQRRGPVAAGGRSGRRTRTARRGRRLRSGSGSTAARRCGRSVAWRMRRCRCSPPPIAGTGPGRKPSSRRSGWRRRPRAAKWSRTTTASASLSGATRSPSCAGSWRPPEARRLLRAGAPRGMAAASRWPASCWSGNGPAARAGCCSSPSRTRHRSPTCRSGPRYSKSTADLVLNAAMLACHGRLQREGEVIHVIAERCEDLSDLLRGVGARDGDDAAGIIKVATRDFR